ISVWPRTKKPNVRPQLGCGTYDCLAFIIADLDRYKQRHLERPKELINSVKCTRKRCSLVISAKESIEFVDSGTKPSQLFLLSDQLLHAFWNLCLQAAL